MNPAEWTKLVWWSFYEGDASFEHFIEKTLKYLKIEPPQGQRPQVDALLKAMQGQKILLIMDGFERALRAYSSMNAAYQGDSELPSPLGERQGGGVDSSLDCVNINAEIFFKSVCSLPNIKSKDLMTTRLTPRAVKPRGEFMLGCHEVDLTSMQPADAVEFFRKQGIKGTHTEIEAACAPYGYHPLSLRLLAGRILKDFDNPADIVVAQKLKIDGDIIQQKHHVLEASYDSLPKHEQKLLSTIACFRSPVELQTLQSIAENKDTLDNDLHDLVERGLLHFDEKNKKFDLHPIVRRYAYERLTAPDRTAAHTRLRDYFAAVDVPAQLQSLDDLAPVIELYHHSVKAGELDKAWQLYRDRLWRPIYYQLGSYQKQIELIGALFIDGESKLPSLRDAGDQAHVMNELGSAYALSGQPKRAAPFYEAAINIYENVIKNKNYLAVSIGAIAQVTYISTGALRAAETNLQRMINLNHETQDDRGEAIGYREVGLVLIYRGLWNEAKSKLNKAIDLFDKIKFTHGIGVTWSYFSLSALLLERSGQLTDSLVQFAINALNFANEWAKNQYPIEREFVRTHWLLGAAYRVGNQLSFAEQHLIEALTRDRAINMVDHEANILLDLARLRYDQKNYEEAKSLAEEALLITERCGYVLQGADVNLFLTQYALEQEKDKVKAKAYAEEALKLATCDGPPYYYKVAYEEAERFLEKL